MAAVLLRRDPSYARLRERERIERAMESAMRRLQERRVWMETYAAVVDDLLGDGWKRATRGTCAACGGTVVPRDLGAVLDELGTERSDDETRPASGPGLVCPVRHVVHVTCIAFEIETAPGDERIVGRCVACAEREG